VKAEHRKAKTEHRNLLNVPHLRHPFQLCGVPGRCCHCESASCNSTKL